MVSHKNVYPQCLREFHNIFLTFKLIKCFIDGSTSGMKSQSIVYLLSGSAHIYWVLNLKVTCTQYEICGQVAFKTPRAMCFFFPPLKSGRARRLPWPLATYPLKACGGRFNIPRSQLPFQ